MPQSLSFLHVRRSIPGPSVLLQVNLCFKLLVQMNWKSFQGAIGLCVLFIGEIVELLEFASFLLWISYGCAMVSVLIFRKTKKDAPRPFKVRTSWKLVLVSLLTIVIRRRLSLWPA